MKCMLAAAHAVTHRRRGPPVCSGDETAPPEVADSADSDHPGGIDDALMASVRASLAQLEKIARAGLVDEDMPRCVQGIAERQFDEFWIHFREYIEDEVPPSPPPPSPPPPSLPPPPPSLPPSPPPPSCPPGLREQVARARRQPQEPRLLHVVVVAHVLLACVENTADAAGQRSKA